MKNYIALMTFIGASAVATSAAAACPQPVLSTGEFSASGADLIQPQNWEVVADGAVAVPCAEWVEQGISAERIDGFLPSRPTAVFDLEGLGPHILMVMAQSQCDPRLAVRTLDGLWHFGEQANGRQEIVVWSASDGPLQVWVGAGAQEQCEATLTLETFDR